MIKNIKKIKKLKYQKVGYKEEKTSVTMLQKIMKIHLSLI